MAVSTLAGFDVIDGRECLVVVDVVVVVVVVADGFEARLWAALKLNADDVVVLVFSFVVSFVICINPGVVGRGRVLFPPSPPPIPPPLVLHSIR